jgi:flagellar biosynthesis GTPase FlhF
MIIARNLRILVTQGYRIAATQQLVMYHCYIGLVLSVLVNNSMPISD